MTFFAWLQHVLKLASGACFSLPELSHSALCCAASVIPGVTAASPSVAPAPAIQADARYSIEHPASPSTSVTDVFFTLILTGQDAVVSLAPIQEHDCLTPNTPPAICGPLGPC